MAVTEKNIRINFKCIALLSIIASGRLRAATAIMKDKAVPRGNPFWNKATAIGTIAAQLPYIGTPIIVAIGTLKNPVLLIIFCTSSWGIKL